MDVLLLLLVCLGIITLIGHGLWVLVAAIVRALVGTRVEPIKAPPQLLTQCAECGASLQREDKFCVRCGHWQGASSGNAQDELLLVARRLNLLLEQGRLDAATHARVRSVIEAEQARLSETPRPAVAAQTPPVLSEATPPATLLSAPPAQTQPSPKLPATSPPPKQQRTLNEMLAAFREERSIQWGELVGGLLIIGSSLALVVSLWAQIAAVPLIKYAVFVGLTAGLFGLGFYSAHRWRLPTTSRAVLIIAALLVPLNFLAMTAFSQQDALASALALGGELLALALFAVLVYLAARVIVPGRAWWLIGATLGPSCALLLAQHWGNAITSTLLLGGLPMACYWGVAGALRQASPGREEPDENETTRVFTLFGIAAFAALLPLGLLFVKTGDLAHATHRFAWLVSLFGVPAISVGLAVWQRANNPASNNRRRGANQTVATSLALIGALLALTGLLRAWPHVAMLLAIALLNAVVCLWAAWRYGWSWAHTGAVTHLTLAYLIGCNLLAGRVSLWEEDGRNLASALLSATASVALLPWSALLLMAAEWRRRIGQKIESGIYVVAGTAAGALSLLLATGHGLSSADDARRAALIYAVYALMAGVMAWRREARPASWLGAVLLLGALIEGVVFGYGDALTAHHPLRLALLSYAGLLALGGLILPARVVKARHLFITPAIVGALAGLAAVIVGEWLRQWLSAALFAEVWPLSWLVIALSAALLVVCVRLGEGDRAWPGLYVVGLIIIGRALLLFQLVGEQLLLSTVIAAALYAGLTSWLWRRQWSGDEQLLSSGARAQRWLAVATMLLTGFVTLSNLGIIFSQDSLAQRLAATSFAGALPLAFILLAAARTQWLITTGIRVAVLKVMLWGWAWLAPRATGQVSKRLVILMVIATAIVIASRLLIAGQRRDESGWPLLVRAELPWLVMLGLAALAGVLGVELNNYLNWGAALVSWPEVTAVWATLICLMAASLVFALLPGADPFAWDERRRTRYVYAAEGFTLLTLLHLRLTMPWLFTGFLATYWPLLVMAVAFAGVGVSELCRRQGRLVLAEPLEKTGALLPLLPVFGFWLSNPPLSYSGLLLLVGLFYGVLSVMRRSFAFGLLAALAGNSGLWHFLSGRPGYGFFEHPQLWLIPVALSVLAAAQINRARLSLEQMATVRYAALIVIYVSSTADIFINGVSASPWLPVALALLSVGGVITGLLLRIRAFLFLGTAFLLLALLTMIWSAAVNLGWEWLWYVSGIAIGVLIIYTFALFERRRAELLNLVERLKQWQ